MKNNKSYPKSSLKNELHYLLAYGIINGSFFLFLDDYFLYLLVVILVTFIYILIIDPFLKKKYSSIMRHLLSASCMMLVFRVMMLVFRVGGFGWLIIWSVFVSCAIHFSLPLIGCLKNRLNVHISIPGMLLGGFLVALDLTLPSYGPRELQIMMKVSLYKKENNNLEESAKILLEIIEKSSQSRRYAQIEVEARYLLGEILVGHEAFFSEAIENANSGIKIASEFDDVESQRNFYNQLGNIHEELGVDHYTKAQKFYEKALEKDIFLEDQEGQAITYNNLGNISELLTDLDNAIKYYEKSLDIFTKLLNQSGQCMIYTNLGGLYQKKGDFKLAIQYQTDALHLANKLKKYKTEANACLNLGYCYFAIDDFSESLNYFQRTLVVVHTLRDRTREVKALKGSGDCYLELNFPEKAKFYYRKTIPHLELMQQNLNITERRSFLKEYLEIYQSLVTVCIQTDDLNGALFYAETSRNRYFIERLVKHEAPLPNHLSEELSQQIHRAKLQERQALELYANALSRNSDQHESSELSSNYYEAKKALQKLYDKVSIIDPEFILKTRVHPISFTEIQSLLPSSTALIEFFFVGKKLVSMLILPGMESPIYLEGMSLVAKHIYLESVAKAWISEITSDSPKKDDRIEDTMQDLPNKIKRISELLKLHNLLDYIPENIKNLIVVPHNYLHLFPIHALWLNPGERIIDRFSVQYFPSILVWKVCQNRKRNHWRFLGIENPTQDKNLIFAKVEVASISQSRYFVQPTILSGSSASKSAILESAKQNECFHFSGHAEYNCDNPLDSYLMISNYSDENLSLSSIFSDLQMPLADLVTLSACCTGVVDAFQPTDEYLGLPTGFLFAGAKAVVSSLWKVNSIATAFLLDEFYRQLEESPDKAVALQKAQNWLRTCTANELRQRANEWDLSKLEWEDRIALDASLRELRGTPFENPYFWSPFILTGC